MSLAAGLFAGLTLCSCGSDAPQSAAPSWHEFRSGFQGGLLLSVWGHSPDDVWVVGGRPGATAVLHGTRDTLRAVDNPGQQTAWWVCGLGNRVAIVGEGGLVMIESSPGEFERIDVGIDS
ncbi:MAG TPA: hypothetical protein VL137_08775, partial [Polyangiaceae bacterium]|nr:hypothetical protein [Polyangiaceae bacterium]